MSDESAILAYSFNRVTRVTKRLQVDPLIGSAAPTRNDVVDISGEFDPANVPAIGIAADGMGGQKLRANAPPPCVIATLGC